MEAVAVCQSVAAAAYVQGYVETTRMNALLAAAAGRRGWC